MEEQQTQVKTPSKKPPQVSKPKKRRRGSVNFLLFVGLIAAISMFVWAENQRRDVSARLAQTEQQLEEIRESTQRSGSSIAQEVLNNVRVLIDLPTDPEPTVATITDINRLREANEFYNKAENGDHLIITERRAILYDPDRNIILDVVPVSLNRDTEPGDADESAEETNRTAPAAQETPDTQTAPAAETAETESSTEDTGDTTGQ
ncbi:hypothetical protein IH781_03910 [Patescibacteria group bacterium]|nr:hypothetical protein [Patescibacteria group bacterium]